jgi:thymidylate synthase
MSDESISEEGIFNPFDFAYSSIVKNILDTGETRKDRTGVGTISVFGRMLRFDLRKGFPLLTTKRVPFKSVLSECLWFIEGSGDERRLAEILYGKDRSELAGKTTIWTENAEAPYWKPKAKFEGDLGRVYGTQWRKWRTVDGDVLVDPETGEMTAKIKEVDQLSDLIEGIKKDPFGRRHILNAWNPGELDQMALPPCHVLTQFSVSKDGALSSLLFMR